MDVAALQSSVPGGIARSVQSLRSSGEMATATSPPMLQRKPRSRVPRSIPSRRPREKAVEFSYWSLVTGHRNYES